MNQCSFVVQKTCRLSNQWHMITNYWSGFLRTVLAHIKQCLVAFIIYDQLSSHRSCSYDPWYDLEKSVLTQMKGSFPLKSGAEPLTYFASPAPSVSLGCVLLSSFPPPPYANLQLYSPSLDTGPWCGVLREQGCLGRTVVSCTE